MANYDSDSTHVLAVQNAVNAAGYTPPLVTDGVYGPKTAAGVKWFQGLHGLTQDGIIGDLTMAATIAAPPAQLAATIAPTVQAITSLVGPVMSLPGAAQAAQAAASTASSQPRPVIHLGGVGAAAAALGPVAVPALAAAAAPVAAAAAQDATMSLVAKALPFGLGALGALGAFFLPIPLAVPIKIVGGAVVGGLGGLLGGKAIEPKPAAKATMHGESIFGMDVNFDDVEGSVVAGDIGMLAPYSSMKG